MFTIKLDGLDALRLKLRHEPKTLAKVVAKGVRAALKHAKKALKAEAKSFKHTGALDKSIISRVYKSRTGAVFGKAGPNNQYQHADTGKIPNMYAKILEEGGQRFKQKAKKWRTKAFMSAKGDMEREIERLIKGEY